MNNENKLILLTSLQKKDETETATIKSLICEKIDWAYVIGQLIHHRLTGYFINGLPNECKKYMFNEVAKQFNFIVSQNKYITETNMNYMQEIFNEFESNGISYAGLKGVIFNVDLYDLGIRRSNDIDILVPEYELNKVDEILRKRGFIQSFDKGNTEASKKEKIIQRLNHHDLVPYYKKNDNSIFVPFYKIDVNFKMDSDKEGLTEKTLEFGTELYEKNGYKLRGLVWQTHLLQLCLHFSREARHSIWASEKRDCMLYKIVDIENTIRNIGKEKLNLWLVTMKDFECDNDIFYTFYYLNEFYPCEYYEQIINMLNIDNKDYLKEIKMVGSKNVVIREKSLYDKTFDLKYCINFSNIDYKKTDMNN